MNEKQNYSLLYFIPDDDTNQIKTVRVPFNDLRKMVEVARADIKKDNVFKIEIKIDGLTVATVNPDKGIK